MQKGIKTRLIIYEILKELKNTPLSYDNLLSKKLKTLNISQPDKNMIHNVVLNSMRYHLHVLEMLKLFVKKRIIEKQFVLLLGAITQIIYLNFKEYAVVNSTVEIAKKKSISIFPGFVNAILKKVILNKTKLQKTQIKFNQLPGWFFSRTNNWKINKKNLFLENIIKTPELHIVFKNNHLMQKFNINYHTTSTKSLTIKNSTLIKKLPNYERGDWWIQDFATMLPIYLIEQIKDKTVLDMCGAPGGKSFQIISSHGKTTIIDISHKRSQILKTNLKRLNYKNTIKIIDALKINIKTKYDYVLIDAPCSAVGTVRRNPEIFYRNHEPNFSDITKLQRKLLEKSTNLIKKNGTIIYMVCSFLEEETTQQIDFFLKRNKNFKLDNFFSNDSNINKLIDKNGYINTIPLKTNNTYHDGFFAAKLKYYV